MGYLQSPEGITQRIETLKTELQANRIAVDARSADNFRTYINFDGLGAHTDPFTRFWLSLAEHTIRHWEGRNCVAYGGTALELSTRGEILVPSGYAVTRVSNHYHTWIELGDHSHELRIIFDATGLPAIEGDRDPQNYIPYFGLLALAPTLHQHYYLLPGDVYMTRYHSTQVVEHYVLTAEGVFVPKGRMMRGMYMGDGDIELDPISISGREDEMELLEKLLPVMKRTRTWKRWLPKDRF